MSGGALTLKSFFTDGGALAVRGADVVAGLSRRMPSGQGLTEAIEAALEEAFDVPLGDVLAASWEQADALSSAFADSREAPDEVVLAPLVDHSVTSTHKPTIDVYCGAKRLAELAFEIELDLQLRGVALELTGGRITGLRSGEVAGHGACNLAGVTLIEKETPPIILPGRVAFGKPERPPG